MVGLTGQMGVPVTVIDGQAVIGFNRARLQQLLTRVNSRKPPRLGLKVTDADRAAREPGEPPVFGAVVGSVAPSSPGERVGIQAGDIITSIGNKRVNNVAELEEILRSLVSSNRVPVTYYRGEKAIKAELII